MPPNPASNPDSNAHYVSAQDVARSTIASQDQARAANIERDLAKQGKMPNLAQVQEDNEAKKRVPGQEDAAGNPIHHKSTLSKLLHWEHDGMNKDS